MTKKVDADRPAFTCSFSWQIRPFTSEAFIGCVRDCLSTCNIGHAVIGTHSFRKGGKIVCCHIRLSPDAIKLLGHWTFSCYQNYIKNDANTRFE